MLGLIVEYDSMARIATIVSTDSGNRIEEVIVPLNIQGLTRQCLVLFDLKEKFVTALISYDMMLPDEQDQIERSPGEEPLTYYNNVQSKGMMPGDIIHQRPYTGFLYLLRGLVSVIGGSGLSKIIMDGNADKILMFAKKFAFSDGKNASLTFESDHSATPNIEINIGKLTVSTNTDTRLKIELGDDGSVFSVVAEDKIIEITIFGKKVMSYDMSSNSVLFETVFDLRYQLINVFLSIKKSLKITVANNVNMDAQAVALNAADMLALTAKTFSGSFTNMNSSAQNIRLTANGNEGKSGGSIQLRGGMFTGLLLNGDSKQVVAKGMKMELLGTGEKLANGDATTEAIEKLFDLVDSLAKTMVKAAATPYTGALAEAAAVSVKAPVAKQLAKQTISNRFIEVPKSTPNGVK